MYRTRRVVFCEYPALPEITAYGEGYGWQLTGEDPDGSRIFTAGRASLEVHYRDDDITHNSYAYAVGATKNVAEALIGMIERDLDCWPRPLLLHAFDQRPDFDRGGQALLRLTLSAPDVFDQDVYDRVAVALRDPDERLRNLAIWATSCTPWPEYRRLLTDATTTDPSDAVRARADRMLASFDAAEIEHV